MIPPGECMYAGRKRRKPIQKQKPAAVNEKSNPSKRHRDRLNAELDRLASLLPFPPDVISKLDKLSVLRLSVSYLRVKSYFQAIQDKQSKKQDANQAVKEDSSAPEDLTLEGDLLLESLNSFALVVSADGMIFYASSTIVDYLGFHQTDVMHQNVFDYIHVDDRQEFRRQLHWAMNPPHLVHGQEHHSEGEIGEEYFLSNLFKAQDYDNVAPEYSSFLNRCFICRVRCLLDSTSGFLTMQFQGRLKFLYGQKKATASGATLPPQLALFCMAVPLLLPSITEMKMKSMLLRAKQKTCVNAVADTKLKGVSNLGETDPHNKTGYQYVNFTDMLHSAENQIRLMNRGENGLSIFRVLTSDNQWVWVQANTQVMYRNGCSEYIIVPQQGANKNEEDEYFPKQNVNGLKESRDVVLHSCTSEVAGGLKQHHWAAAAARVAKDEIKQKCEPLKSDSYFIQDEPINFCRSLINVPKISSTNNAWTSRNSTSSQMIKNCHSIDNASGKTLKPVYSENQGILNTCPRYLHKRESMKLHPSCTGLQHLNMESYTIEDVKSENALMSSAPYYNTGMPLDTPIKIENDSDSENGSDVYVCSQSQAWLAKEDMGKKFLMSFPEMGHLKVEPSPSEQPSPCQKTKHNIHSSLTGHYSVSSNASNPSRPFKGINNKGMTQFSSQQLSHSDSLCSAQSTNCLSGPNYNYSSLEDKEFGDQLYKLQYESKGHNLAHTIKREPLDSPSWCENDQESMQSTFQKNLMPNCLTSSMSQKTTQFAFLQ
nr:PREDICTED: aryl hydrocarbon receptor repressor [Latimeria chalumnae]|eukprot:XP_014346104.1 PREDICTED: aryl hydrocarbon receptor repressor [Latimeria chalumnae]